MLEHALPSLTEVFTYMNTMRNLSLVGHSDNRFQELNENHVEMSVLVYFVRLCHHGQVENITNMSG